MTQVSEVEANEHVNNDNPSVMTDTEECLAHGITTSKSDAEIRISSLEDEIVEEKLGAERLTVHYEYKLKLAHNKVEDAEMRLLQLQESSYTQIKEADARISHLEHELQKAKFDFNYYANDNHKLKSELMQLADELVISQVNISELEEKLKDSEQQVQKLVSQEGTLLGQISTLERIAAASEVKSKEVEEHIALQIELHKAEIRDMSQREESLLEINEKGATELEASEKKILDLENDLKSALVKADEQWGQLRIRDDLIKETSEKLLELQDLVSVGDFKLKDAEKSIDSLLHELEGIKHQVAVGIEKETLLIETEMHLSKVKEDFSNSQNIIADLESKLQIAETKAEEYLKNHILYEKDATASKEKILEFEIKARSTECLVESLENELHELKLSSARDVENWKEMIAKATEREEDLEAKLTASEVRCFDLESSSSQLAATLVVLEESLAAFQSGAKHTDDKAREMDLEYGKSNQLNAEPEENARISKESSLHHKKTFMPLRKRFLELEEMLNLSQDEVKTDNVIFQDLQKKLQELKNSENKDTEVWMEFATESTQLEGDLQTKLKISEGRCKDLELTVRNLQETHSKFDELFVTLHKATELADEKSDKLEFEIEKLKGLNIELEEKLKLSEETSSHNMNCANESLERIILLEDKLKSSEHFSQTLQTELRELQFSGVKTENIWRESAMKSAEREEELQAKLNASEDRCHEVELSMAYLTDASTKLQESLAEISTEFNLANDKARELEIKLEDLQQINVQLEEQVRNSEEKFSDHKKLLEENTELQSVITRHQLDLKNAATRVMELESALAIAIKDVESWRGIATNSTQSEEELQTQLTSYKNRCKDLELTLEHLKKDLNKLEESVTRLQQDAEFANVKAEELVLENETLKYLKLELEERLKLSEETLYYNKIYAKQSLEKTTELEGKLKLSEGFTETLQTELHELKISAARAEEIWREAAAKSAERENKLHEKLKDSENRCQNLDKSVAHLTETSTELKEAWGELHSEVNLSNKRIIEMQFELEKLQHIKLQLEEKVRMSDESLLHHENSAKHFLNKNTELESLVAMHQSESSDAAARIMKLEDALANEIKDTETLREFGAKSVQLQDELTTKLKSSEERCLDLELAVEHLKETSSKNEKSLIKFQQEAKLVDDKTLELEIRIETLKEIKVELEERLKLSEDIASCNKNLSNQSLKRITELEDKLKYSEGCIQTLQFELDEMKLSGSKAEKVWREAAAKSAVAEDEIHSKLKVSEGRCHDLEFCVSKLTETSAKLEKSLAELESEASCSNVKVGELEIELVKLQHMKVELEEKVKISEEYLLCHEASAKQFLERSIELESMITKHQIESRDAGIRITELEAALANAMKDVETQRTLAAKSAQLEEELLTKLRSYEDKCKDLEITVGFSKEASCRLEESLITIQQKAKLAYDKIAQLELEIENLRESKIELKEALNLSEETSATSLERIVELEEELQSSVIFVQTLQIELQELKSSGAKEKEIWRENAVKLAAKESELNEKLKVSEEKCNDLELSVAYLTETSAELEESLSVIKSEANFEKDKAGELEIELGKLQHTKLELEEKLRSSEEYLLHHENNTKQFLERSSELESMIAKHQLESRDSAIRIIELEAALTNARKDVETWSKLAAESAKLEEELQTNLESYEDRCKDLEITVGYLKETSSKLEELLVAVQQKAKLADDKVGELEHEIENLRDSKTELEERLKLSEEAFSKSIERIMELEERLKSSDCFLQALRIEFQGLKLSGAKDEEIWRDTAAKSAEKENELHAKLLVSERTCQDLEFSVNKLTETSANLEELLAAFESEAKLSNVKAGKLEIELEELLCTKMELEESIRMYEERLLHHESSDKQFLERITNFECLVAEHQRESNDSAVMVKELEADLANAIKDVEIWRESAKKSTQIEKDLQTKLRSSEDRCEDLEMTIHHLKETSCRLEESLVAVQQEARLADNKVEELKLENKKLEDLRIELVESKNILEESLSHNKNIANHSIERNVELEHLAEALQAELCAVKLSGIKAEEAWKETAEKLSEREDALQEKLKASEYRCHALEFSVANLTEMSVKTEESLAQLRSDANLANAKVGEFTTEIEKLQQQKMHLEERVMISEERNNEFESLVTKNQTELENSVFRIIELESSLKNAARDLETWKELGEKSVQLEEELQIRLKSSEDRCEDLQLTIVHLKETISGFNKSLVAVQEEAKCANEKVGELGVETKELKEIKLELEERLKLAEETSSYNKNCANQSLERILELEDKLKLNEGFVQTLQTDLHESYLSGAKAEEIWRETAAKSTERENELHEKLKASEERCHSLELSVVHLTETSAKLEQSLATVQSDAYLANNKVGELEIELEKLQQLKVQLQEKVSVYEESLFHHENNARKFLERDSELQSLIKKHQTESKDAGIRVMVLEAALTDAIKGVEKWIEFATKPANSEEELQFKLKGSEDTFKDLDLAVVLLKENSSKFDESLSALKAEAKFANDKAGELDYEIRMLKEINIDLQERLKLAEEVSSYNKNCASESLQRITELDFKLKLSEDFVETLQTELHELKLSGAKSEENWRETVAKLVERENELNEKLRASEERSHGLELSVTHLTETWAELEESLVTLQTDAYHTNNIARELEIEIEKLQQLKLQLQEKLSIFEESLFNHENNARQIMEKNAELESLVAKHETDSKLAVIKNMELEAALTNAIKDVDKWMEFAAKSAKSEEGLQNKLKGSENRCKTLQGALVHLEENSSKLEESLAVLQQEEKIANDKVGELRSEIGKLEELNVELEKRLKLMEETSFHNKESANQSIKKVIELEGKLNVCEGFVQTLQTELHELKLAGAKAEEFWRETAAKSAETEDELQANLRASEVRCHDMELFVHHLTETSTMLEKSLAVLQSENNSLIIKVEELEIEVEKLQHMNIELEVALTNATNDIEMWRELAEKSAQVEEELQMKLNSSEDKCDDLELTIKNLKKTLSRFDESLAALQQDAKDADNKAVQLELEIDKLKEMNLELEERLKVSEETSTYNKNCVNQSLERVIYLEDKLKSCEGFSKTLQTEVHELKLSAAKAEEIWRETASKSAEREDKLHEKLKDSEDRCSNLEFSMDHLIETSARIQSDANLSNEKVRELNTELEKLQHMKVQLEERLIMSEERLLHSEKSANDFLERSSELENLVAKHQTESKDATIRIQDLEALHASKDIDMNIVRSKMQDLELELETAAQSTKVLENKLSGLEIELLERQGVLKQATDRLDELESCLDIANRQIKDATDKVATAEALLMVEEQSRRQAEAEAKILNEKLIDIESAAKQAEHRIAELESFLEASHVQAKNAADLLASNQSFFLSEQQKFEQAKVETNEKLLQLGNAVKHAVDRSTELEELLQILDTQSKDASNKITFAEALLQTEHENSRRAVAELTQQLSVLENALKQATGRTTELEDLLEVANACAKRSEEKVSSTNLILQAEQVDHLKALTESKMLAERTLQLEEDLNQAIRRSRELEFLLEAAKSEAIDSLQRVEATEVLLQAEQENVRHTEAELQVLVEKLLQAEDDLRHATTKSSDLEELLEAANDQIKDAIDKVASLESLRHAEKKNHSQAETEASHKLEQLENVLRLTTSRLDELESFLEAANVQVGESASKVKISEANLQAEQLKYTQLETQTNTRLLQLENDLKKETTKSTELVGLLDTANSEVENANDRAASYETLLQVEQEKHWEAEVKAKHKLSLLEDALKQAISRSTELEALLETANKEVMHATEMTASMEVAFLAEIEKHRQAEAEATGKILQLEDTVKQSNSRLSEFQGFLEASHFETKDAKANIASVQTLLLAEQAKCDKTESEAKHLTEELFNLREQYALMQSKYLTAESRILELELLETKLKTEENSICTLNDMLSATEERANKAESDLHAAVLTKAELREEVTSLHLLIDGLQSTLAQVESEKTMLAAHIDDARSRIYDLEPLVERLKASDSLVSSLTEKLSVAEAATVQAETDLHAAIITVSNLREELHSNQTSMRSLKLQLAELENEKQVLMAETDDTGQSFTVLNKELACQKEQLQLQDQDDQQMEKNVYKSRSSQSMLASDENMDSGTGDEILESNTQCRDKELDQADQQIEKVVSKPRPSQTMVASDESMDMGIGDQILEKNAQGRNKELKVGIRQPSIAEIHEIPSSKLREAGKEDAVPLEKNMRRKRKVKNAREEERLTCESKFSVKLKQPHSPASVSPLLFSLCVISVLSVCTGFWIARRIYL